MNTKRTVWIVAVGLVMAITLSACSGTDSNDGGGGEGVAPAEESVRDQATSGAGGSVGFDSAISVGQDLPGLGPAVIKTARLVLEVPRDGLQEAVDDAFTVAESSGGFVLSTRLAGESEGRGAIVLRVPAEGFESALAGLDDLGEVDSRTVSGQDVSEEFVDLEARLRNFEAQETVLLRLMDRAQSVSDTIKVQRELTGIQLEVERIRGRLRFLDDQTTLGTITVEFNEAGVVAAKASTIGKAWARAGELFLSFVSGLVVSLGVVVPLAVLALLALVAFRMLRPRLSSN